MAFVPGQRQLLVGETTGRLSLIDCDSGTSRHLKTEYGDYVSSVTFSPDGKLLAATSLDGTATLIDTATWSEKFQLLAQDTAIWSAAFSPDGKTLATGGADGQVRLWHVATGRELFSLDHGSGPSSIALRSRPTEPASIQPGSGRPAAAKCESGAPTGRPTIPQRSLPTETSQHENWPVRVQAVRQVPSPAFDWPSEAAVGLPAARTGA